jgi:ATP/maltotriose-dependent transcriptional regulator MalT/DNA-binding SARP family transcriptional activator
LQDRLAKALTRRLTTVVAPAGFGKSTLLTVSTVEILCAWYTLDPRDASIRALAAGLVAALRERLPGLSSDLLPAAGAPQGSGPAEQDRAEALAAHLSEALAQQLTDDLVLVLDDVHEVARGTAGARLIEALVRQSPPRLHVVISSRVQPPFPIERLRGRGEVSSLDPADLAFSVDEVAELLHGASAGGRAEIAGRLHAMTGGWPAAVVLAVEALRGASPERVSDILEGLRHPGSHLFAYLAEEVFEGEPEPVRSLLARVAVFPRFTVELCEAVGTRDARKTIADLLSRGLFIQSAGGNGWYGLHALVREFALRAYPLEPNEARRLHRRAADWFEAGGYMDEALGSLTAAGDSEGLAEFLASRGRELLSRGALGGFLASAGTLPEELRSSELETLRGEAYLIQGRYEEATQCYERAVAMNGTLTPALAWGLGRVYADQGHTDKAVEIYQRAVMDGSNPQDEVLLLVALASTYFFTRRPEECRAVAARALEMAVACGKPRALAAAHTVLMLEALGRDPKAVAEHYRVAIAAVEEAHDILISIRIRLNWSVRLMDEGRYQDALEEVEIGLSQAELAGYTLYVMTALNNHGESLFHLGRLDAAVADFQRCRRLSEQVGVRTGFALAHLSMVFRERGDLAMARGFCEEALADDSRRIGGRADLTSLNLALAIAFEEPERARGLVDQVVAGARGFLLHLGATLIGAGWVALARSDREEAEAFAMEAEGIARAGGKPAELAEALEIRAMCATDPAQRLRLLREALSIWRQIGNTLGQARAEYALARLSSGPLSRIEIERAERRLRDLGVRPAAAAGAAGLLGSLPRDEDRSLEIRTLGGFQVLRRGRPVTATDWQSKKARDLLRILISHRGRPVPRDVLTDALWPEEDSERLARRLSVALATARSVLDPDRRLPSDHFLAGDDEAVRLDLAHAPVDVERFLDESSAGLALLRQGRREEAQEVLISAEAAYSGDFLQEDPYVDWSTALREEARTTYIAVTRALARSASTAGDHESAAHYRLRILERDPYDEEAHLGLVTSLAAAGQHGEARRAYQTYVSRMGELDVEPVPFPVTHLNAT